MSFQGIGFPNPFLTQGVFSILPAGQRAAYSQDIGSLVFFTSGQPLPTNFFPQVPPFTFNSSFGSFFDNPFKGFGSIAGLGSNGFLG